VCAQQGSLKDLVVHARSAVREPGALVQSVHASRCQTNSFCETPQACWSDGVTKGAVLLKP